MPTPEINNQVPHFTISGRIKSSDQEAINRENLPIFCTLVTGKVPDDYTPPPRWAVKSNVRFGKEGDIVKDIKTEVRCRSYLANVVDKRTGEVTKVQRYTHELWLVP